MITVESFLPPPVKKPEILRYAKAKPGDPAVEGLMAEVVQEAKDLFSYRVCSARFPIEQKENGIRFAGIETDSETLCAALADCEELLLFAATVGVEIDRVVTRYGRVSPAKALMFQAYGAERIESLCEAFITKTEKFLSEEHLFLKPRVSPGYGDIPLSLQKEIFALLDCPRKIGLTLHDSLLMTPTKSVTAIAGISRCGPAEKTYCENCEKKDCGFRREGEAP